ncbi:hypothetical protein HHK36_022780 [Tetracentron sinense]|uniref:FAF domain-containing protein n=1 Tax=Tetracentron sinense TaxID=13715 RepID=A0A834YTV9_TETSI|nr:hypothetical protein HHK36_022780 [Tetracentron sinense]
MVEVHIHALIRRKTWGVGVILLSDCLRILRKSTVVKRLTNVKLTPFVKGLGQRLLESRKISCSVRHHADLIWESTMEVTDAVPQLDEPFLLVIVVIVYWTSTSSGSMDIHCMSSIVCQGLQPFLEPRLVEPWSLRLKLTSPRPNFSPSFVCTRRSTLSDSDTEEPEEKCHSDETNMMTSDNFNTKNISNDDLGGWSCIQALTNTSRISKETIEKEGIYVHPLINCSSPRLSKKSLELCTENLGCETGTHISESNNFSSSLLDSESSKPPTRERMNMRNFSRTRKVNCPNFPPPLTSISGSDRVLVKHRREGGRLVIKSITVPSSRTYFEAERGDGRLQLWFSKNCSPVEEIEGNSKEENDQGVEEDVEEEEEDEEESDVYLGEEMDGNNRKIGDEMRIGKFQRPTRCKEGGNKGLLVWEPFLVATTS